MKKIVLFIFLGLMPLLFSACVSVSTENLATTPTIITTTTASSAIQLHRVSTTQRTIFFLWKNNTKINEQLNAAIMQALQQSGYRLMETPQQAHYEVQITLLQVGLANQQQLKEMMASDYNNPLLTLAPADVSNLNLSDADVVNLSGLTPVMVLDVQVSEKSAEGNAIAWNRYQTRIITRSVQPNVSFQQEQAQMNREAVAEIGKIFS